MHRSKYLLSSSLSSTQIIHCISNIDHFHFKITHNLSYNPVAARWHVDWLPPVVFFSLLRHIMISTCNFCCVNPFGMNRILSGIFSSRCYFGSCTWHGDQTLTRKQTAAVQTSPGFSVCFLGFAGPYTISGAVGLLLLIPQTMERSWQTYWGLISYYALLKNLFEYRCSIWYGINYFNPFLLNEKKLYPVEIQILHPMLICKSWVDLVLLLHFFTCWCCSRKVGSEKAGAGRDLARPRGEDRGRGREVQHPLQRQEEAAN